MITKRNRRSIVAALLAGAALSGCASSTSRPRIVSHAMIDPQIEAFANANAHSLYRVFMEAEKDAYANQGDAEAQRRFMGEGFVLVKDRCRAYLTSKSNNQRGLNVWRDTFAPLTALITGVVGLVDKGDKIDNKFLLGLGLGTTAASSAIGIYEERFLFGAENVDNVRLLLDNALDVDAQEKLELPDAKLRYSKSLEHILSSQLICSPPYILDLAKKAIANGKIVPRSGKDMGGKAGGGDKANEGKPDSPDPQGVTIAPPG
jgi:hypothetical protein